jgi:hypothetical protein
VTVNDEPYEIAASQFDTIRFDGGLGNDEVTLVGSASSAEQYAAMGKSAQLTGQGYLVSVTAAETVRVDTQGQPAANDEEAVIDDTYADDTFVAEFEGARMSAFFYDHDLRGFEKILARSPLPGDDSKEVEGSLDYVLQTEGSWN